MTQTSKHPFKKGQRFKFMDAVYTVAGFFGASYVLYDTYSEAYKANKGGLICIQNVEFGEFGGATAYETSILIQEG